MFHNGQINKKDSWIFFRQVISDIRVNCLWGPSAGCHLLFSLFRWWLRLGSVLYCIIRIYIVWSYEMLWVWSTVTHCSTVGLIRMQLMVDISYFCRFVYYNNIYEWQTAIPWFIFFSKFKDNLLNSKLRLCLSF